MNQKQPMTGPVRDKPPCGSCTEKFEGCHGRCPKDERGEYGYQAFLDRLKQVKAARREYDMKHNKHFHDYKEESKDAK